MRIIALLVLLFGFSEAALAQTSECKSTGAADLLACYETGAPPVAAIKQTAKTATASHKPAASKAPADQEQVVDFLEAETKNHLPGI
jgi:hypothetical protein